MPQKGVQPEWLKGKGGRPKGSPTKFKREAWESLHTQLDALNFNALETAVKWIRSRRCPVSEKARLLTCIMSLQFPRVQAIASVKKIEHSISPAQMAQLMQDPLIAQAFEKLTFMTASAPGERLALPAPETGVNSVEFDQPGAGL
jgi:hypothetical protein